MATRDEPPADVDVIVVTWNSALHLVAALTALPTGVRTIVVDNGSTDESVALARQHGARTIELGRNLGFAAAVNIGLDHVTARDVLLLNPDVVVAPGCIDRCLEVLHEDESIGVVGPSTTTLDGRPEPAAARRDRRAWHIVIESLGLVHISRRLDRQMIHGRAHDQDVDAINGAFMLMPTSVLRELGGLDQSVFMYLEDQDLCRRVRDRGWRVRFVATARAVHEGGASTAAGDGEQQARAYLHRIDADVEFLRRYGGQGEAGLAVSAYVVRSLVGLFVSVARPERRLRYRAALRYALVQRKGRVPAPPV